MPHPNKPESEPEPSGNNDETSAALVDLSDTRLMNDYVHMMDPAIARHIIQQANSLKDARTITNKFDFLLGAIAYVRELSRKRNLDELEASLREPDKTE